MRIRAAILLTAAVLLAGCWNGGNTQLHLGNVSVGQQLIDLKRALDADAITPAEYEETKQALLSLANLCRTTEDEDG